MNYLGNHADVTRPDEEYWKCNACGAESHDWALFSELGEDNKCLETVISTTVHNIGNNVVNIKTSLKEFSKAVNNLNDVLAKLSDKIKEKTSDDT